MKSEEKAGSGFGPGLGVLMRQKLASAFVGRGKKQSGRTPLEPRRQPAHHLNRWRDEGRQALVLSALRLGVLPDTTHPPVGRGGYFQSWKTLSVAVEQARKASES